ncbi:monocarboxylate transporter 12-B-like [Watersipora subatra]|uniref:monocarboxylate transporter 12-B-like n=1 Tax=Watersipora subatra TaxID=2589382 RepID=UPI00355B2C65
MAARNHKDLPIDTGWAWVITFASCGMFGMAAGGQKCFGIILVEMEEEFPEEPVQKILWLFSCVNLCNKLSAPLNGIILAKTSHRTLGLIAVSLMSLSLVAFAYLPKLEYMYPFFGVVFGLGCGMSVIVALTSYCDYFDKKKALALGLTAAGSGIFSAILPNLLRVLFDNFTFSGAILLYAGVCLQIFVLACLLRPISYYKRGRNSSSELSLTTYSTGEEKKLETDTHMLEENHPRERSNSFHGRLYNQPNSMGDFLSTPNISSLPASQINPKHDSYKMAAFSMQDVSASQLLAKPQSPDSDDEENKAVKESKLNWKIILNPRYVLLLLGLFIYFAGLAMTYSCLPSLGKESNVSKTFIPIAIAGAGGIELFMRIVNGWFADRKIISAFNHIAICMTFTGAMAALCATFSGKAGIVLMLLGNSTMGTSVISLLPIVSVELLGKQNLYSAMSFNYFTQGLSLIVSTFITSAVYEASASWRTVFFYLAGCNLGGALILTLTAIAAKCLSQCYKTAKDKTDLNGKPLT